MLDTSAELLAELDGRANPTEQSQPIEVALTGPDGSDIYTNHAVLFVTARWWQRRCPKEDCEDTQRVTEYDRFLTGGA